MSAVYGYSTAPPTHLPHLILNTQLRWEAAVDPLIPLSWASFQTSQNLRVLRKLSTSFYILLPPDLRKTLFWLVPHHEPLTRS
ncbi:hypothetical protein M407DRAFT_24882 [Tulasnella calospora MUT 4182]|uniref:Uncharacterized protein n=1 Tax=Tulasnella calospora MUT 4182 TaxID=1051891 RepID=A0A0C3LWV5_9AGAM|nr:hypothetical protein M407DRAFT_24882 [Tulasnella calospora MUT 4182]